MTLRLQERVFLLKRADKASSAGESGSWKMCAPCFRPCLSLLVLPFDILAERFVFISCIAGVSPHIIDKTKAVLEKLLQPFDNIPERYDPVALEALLNTDFQTRVPCPYYSVASEYESVFEYSTTEVCHKLGTVVSMILEGPPRPEGSTECALVSFWDRIVGNIPDLVKQVLNFPFSARRNIVDESLSTFMDRRDYLLFLENLPVVFGEEKPNRSQWKEATDDLLSKHRGAQERLYGQLKYVLCYAAAGQSRFQFFAVLVSAKLTRFLAPVTGIMDMSFGADRVQVLRIFINVMRWAITVHQKNLIGTPLAYPMYVPFVRESPYGPSNMVEITIFGNHVRKTFDVPSTHLSTLREVYLVLQRGKIRHTIILEDMKVDGKVELPETSDMSQYSEEIICSLPFHQVVLRLSPVATAVGPANEDDLKHLVYCILTALSDLHANKICHRDIRMANILRSGKDWILIDFELAGKDGDDVFWSSSTLLLGSKYHTELDLQQLGRVVANRHPKGGLWKLGQDLSCGNIRSVTEALAALDVL